MIAQPVLRSLVALCLVAGGAFGASPAVKGEITLTPPSGHPVTFQDSIADQPGPHGYTLRFRFIAPQLAGDLGFDENSFGQGLPEDLSEDDLATMTEAEIEDHFFISPDEIIPDTPAPAVEGAERAADAELSQPAEAPTYDPGADAGVQRDAQWLCDHFAIDRIASTGPHPAQIIISLSDQPVEFGEFAPNVVQSFEAFQIAPDGKSCLWEPF